MHDRSLDSWRHDHLFHSGLEAVSERRTMQVVVLTALTMVVEIAAGVWFDSMALLADGWHMSTHAAALGIAVFAYRYARRHANNPRYTFGTGKVGSLGGFASGVILIIIALLMVWESAERFIEPRDIQFDGALAVAVLGLAVNLLSAWLLARVPHDHHGHAHHGHAHKDHMREDQNLRGAYLHVLTDALTSVLAIVALLAGKYAGWVWMDPMMGIVGAIVIGWWCLGLLRDSSHVLLDGDADAGDIEAIRGAIEGDADNRVADLHVWRVGPRHLAAIVSLVTREPRPLDHYKGLLAGLPELVHLTVEVNLCPDSESGTTLSGDAG